MLVKVVLHDNNKTGRCIGDGSTVSALVYRGALDNPAFSFKLVADLRYAAAIMAVGRGSTRSKWIQYRIFS
jgi:hypothetical protein